MNDEESTVDASSHSDSMHTENGYSLWEFTGREWNLRKDASQKGAIAGKPPQVAGLFTGQIRSIPSVAQ